MLTLPSTCPPSRVFYFNEYPSLHPLLCSESLRYWVPVQSCTCNHVRRFVCLYDRYKASNVSLSLSFLFLSLSFPSSFPCRKRSMHAYLPRSASRFDCSSKEEEEDLEKQQKHRFRVNGPPSITHSTRPRGPFVTLVMNVDIASRRTNTPGRTYVPSRDEYKRNPMQTQT